MKKIKLFVFIVAVFNLFFMKTVFANSTYNYLIFVNNNFDRHPIYLKSYSTGYWVQQASILKNSSKSIFASSANCEKNHYGKLILSLEPHLFYNPLMKTLYGKISTKVYGVNGKILIAISTEDEMQGSLTILHEKLIDQLYKKILVKTQNQIEASELINFYLKQSKDSIEGTFCSILN
jgi:hypothetical protein